MVKVSNGCLSTSSEALLSSLSMHGTAVSQVVEIRSCRNYGEHGSCIKGFIMVVSDRESL